MAAVVKWIKDRPRKLKGRTSTENISNCSRHHDRPLPEVPKQSRKNAIDDSSESNPLFITKRQISSSHVYEEIPYDLVKDLNRSTNNKGRDAGGVENLETKKQGGPYMVVPFETWKYMIQSNGKDSQIKKQETAYRRHSTENELNHKKNHNVLHRHSDSGFGSVNTSFVEFHPTHNNNGRQQIMQNSSTVSLNQDSYQSFGSSTSKTDSNYTYNEYDIQNSTSSSTGSADDGFADCYHGDRNHHVFSEEDSMSPQSSQSDLDYYMEKVKQNLKFEEEVHKMVRDSETSDCETDPPGAQNAYIHLNSLLSTNPAILSRCKKGKSTSAQPERHGSLDNIMDRNGIKNKEMKDADVEKCNNSAPQNLFYRCYSDSELDVVAIENSAMVPDNDPIDTRLNLNGLQICVTEPGSRQVYEKKRPVCGKDNGAHMKELTDSQSKKHSNMNSVDLSKLNEDHLDKSFTKSAFQQRNMSIDPNQRKCFSYSGYGSNRTLVNVPESCRNRDRKKVSFDEKISELVGRSNKYKEIQPEKQTIGTNTSDEVELTDKRHSSPFQPVPKSNRSGSAFVPSTAGGAIASDIDIHCDAMDRLSFRVSKLTTADVKKLRNSSETVKPDRKLPKNSSPTSGANFTRNGRSSGALNELLKRNYDRQLLIFL